MPETARIAPDAAPDAPAADALDPAAAFDMIERLFYGYRDFVGIADAHLAGLGYGRAHHRVLHFVDRNPGLTVGELLAILKVTKQGVARVLKTLIDDGLIEVRPGPRDRREKRLAPTPKGAALAHELMEIQGRWIAGALAPLEPGARDTVARFLAGLVEPGERAAVLARIAAGRV
jgi:DNA-binding MarR family transcriptional regulator